MVTVGDAEPGDIAALMRIERGDGFGRLVGRWGAAEHAAEMAVPGSRYLAARSAEGVEGFALLQGLDDPEGCATLRRIAVLRPGLGVGAALLAAAQGEAFAERGVHRLELRVYPENARARRAYARTGFAEEGVLRDVARAPDGTRRSMLVMSILRPEWDARRGG